MRRPFRRPAALLLLLGTLVSGLADAAHARPRPGTHRPGFRLFARSVGALTINQVYCGLTSFSDICRDTLGSGVAGGGYWPKGTADEYLFASNFLYAAIVGPDGGPWAGDTAWSGRTEEVQPLYNVTNPGDYASWPAGAYVPQGDPAEALFDPLLRGLRSASQGDVWSMLWDGNPIFSTGRGHPLGVLVETRGMGWNAPAGNEDIIYFVFNLYNVTASDCAVYAGLRTGVRQLLCDQGQKFQQLNNAKFGVTLPTGGYTIESLYAGLIVDPDLANYARNLASANVPFSLGFAWDHTFGQEPGWTFDPRIFGPPFFAGSGLFGAKFLSSPLAQAGQSGLTLFNVFTLFNQPEEPRSAWRFLSGNLDPSLGDLNCNTGDPAVTHICQVEYATPQDVRFAQSSGPLTLPPGGVASVVVAYIFAAPVRVDGCGPPCDVLPDDPTRWLDPLALAGGANTIDSLAGFDGFLGDLNGNGRVDQDEITVVPGSLLDKARVAQTVFDRHFLLPFAPDAPEFFLIPDDNQVAVLWRPSASETTGDPFFQIASQPLDGSGQPNLLYDPNYRQQDVEGYRIYRGRVDSPGSLQLLAQFDYAGTLISDYTGQINVGDECAPEFGIQAGCPIAFDSVGPGVARTQHVEYDLVGNIVQVQFGRRAPLRNGKVVTNVADTAVVGGGLRGPCAPSACPALANTGVPFAYVDRTPRSGFRYFYAVTAFDVNSYQSAPSSLESARITKAVTPQRGATTYVTSVQLLPTVVSGRGARVDSRFSQPVIDPATGRFSGPFPATDAATLSFPVALVSQLLGGSLDFSATLDSIDAGSAYDDIPLVYHITAVGVTGLIHLDLPVLQDPGGSTSVATFSLGPLTASDSVSLIYGGSGGVSFPVQAGISLTGNYYTSAWGRGCINGAPGFDPNGVTCSYNGTRWFDGPSPAANETAADPNFGNGAVALAPNVDRALPNNAGFANAGHLTGVDVIHQPLAYLTMPNVYRVVHGALGSFKRAADYNVYWSAGTPGRIDSVVDVTHNVPLPLDSIPARGMNTGFGILNQADAQPVAGSFDGRTELTLADFDCVEPLRHLPSPESRLPCGADFDPTDGPLYVLSRQASLGPIAFAATDLTDFQTSANTGTGFGLYLAGNIYLIQTGTLPSGVVWSLRDYTGAITGGNGFGGSQGSYAFTPAPRPFSAQGVTVTFPLEVTNAHRAVTAADLDKVHTVPDPYYVTNEYEQTTEQKVIKFVNLPEKAIIRIYSLSGVLLKILEHNSPTFGGEETWDVRNRNNQVVASGVYFYHIEANVNGGKARRVGRMTIVNFAN
jgi:hypothetical protein